MMVIACMPCSDSIECTSEVVVTETSQDHSEHSHESDLCTPFCICSCCGGQFAVETIKTLKVEPVGLDFPEHIIDEAFYLSEASYSIWQPPKIG